MSSPVKIQLLSFITIDRQQDEAIYMQIAYQIINAIKGRLLEDGDKLPGSRKMAEELEVHRKTVVAALEELQEQGWLETRPNIGVFVINQELSHKNIKQKNAFHHPPELAPYSFRKEFILDTPLEETLEKFYFTDGTPDYRIIKSEELVRFYTSVVRRKKQSTLQYISEERLFFRNQLSYYLNLTRKFHISKNHVLPIAGKEQLYTILSRLLINSGDVVLVASLSYFLPNMIFSQAGAQMKTIPLDKYGMDINYIKNHYRPGDIRLVYINSRSQYPTAVALSNKRKDQLQQLAEDYGFIIIEDDSDYEFSSVKTKDNSIFRKNGGQRVIHVGAFGRFLNPGFQMHFMIAPKDLLLEAEKYLNVFGKPDIMMEKALGELIHQGDIHRYQRKSKKIINERKDLFASLLTTYFGNHITFEIPPSGLAFWIRFNQFFLLTHLQRKAREKGLSIPSICLYQNKSVTALRLGYAHLNPLEMEAAISLLYEAYKDVIPIQVH